jgi:hypothetical protein
VFLFVMAGLETVLLQVRAARDTPVFSQRSSDLIENKGKDANRI